MPRIRSIHPGLFTDEAYMEMSPYAMAAWPGLWCQCDDQGVFEWKPIVLKARLLPGTSIDFAELLAEWLRFGVVRQFEHGGKTFGAVKNFRRFQRPKKPVNQFPLPAHMASFVGLGCKSPLSEIPSQESRDENDVQASPLPPESRVDSEQREEGGDKMEEVESVCDARVRATPPRLISTEADSLADKCLAAIGLDRLSQPENLHGLPYQAQVWVERDYSPASVVATFQQIGARYGPYKPLRFFHACIETAQRESVGKVVAFKPGGRNEPSPIEAARDRLLGRIDAEIAAVEACQARDRAGRNDVELLPPERSVEL